MRADDPLRDGDPVPGGPTSRRRAAGIAGGATLVVAALLLAATVPGAWASAASARGSARPGVPGATGVSASQAPAVASSQEMEQIRVLYERARSVMNTTEPYEAVQLFTQVIGMLEQVQAGRALQPDEREMLVQSHEKRALTRFYFAEEAEAEADLRTVLRLDPDHEVDRSVTPSFLELFDRLREELIATVEIDVTPIDVDLTIDGRAVDPYQRTHSVLAGSHAVEASRPGFTDAATQVELAPGETTAVQLALERTSAVLTLMTRPVGVSVQVDGREIGVTEGSPPEGFVPSGDAARYPAGEFSGELVIEGLLPGEHTLRLERDGYRPRVFDVPVDDIADLSVPPIVLERTEGEILLRGLPDGAAVTVNGEAVSPETGGDGTPVLRLRPGDHHVVVDHGTAGNFEAEVSLADMQTVGLDVVLRPGVVLVGILGGDAIGAGNLMEGLRSGLDSRERWMLLDRRESSASLLADLGIDAATLRGLAEGDAAPDAGVDWSRVQAAFDDAVSGSVYVIGVLDDDIMATHADLWVWPAAPGPASPDRVRALLDDTARVGAVLDSFSVDLLGGRPWLGALLVDGPAGVVVADVTAGGPAEVAGLLAGDEVLSVDGSPVTGAAEVRERIGSVAPGAAVALGVRRGGGETGVEIRIGQSPGVVSLSAPRQVYAALWAAASAELARPDSQVPDWVLQLNMAAAQIHGAAWGDAVNTLRRIQGAPTGPGLGQAVVDYWLGVALEGAGPSYIDAARDAYERAAAAPEARLYHNDGPWVAPRARARLAVLGSS